MNLEGKFYYSLRLLVVWHILTISLLEKTDVNDLPHILQNSIDNYDANGKSKNVRFYRNTPLHKLLIKIKDIEEKYASKEFFEISQ